MVGMIIFGLRFRNFIDVMMVLWLVMVVFSEVWLLFVCVFEIWLFLGNFLGL